MFKVKYLGSGFLSLGILLTISSIGLLIASTFSQANLLGVFASLLTAGATLTVAGATLIYVTLTYDLAKETKLAREREVYQQIANHIVKPLITNISNQNEENKDLLKKSAYIQGNHIDPKSPRRADPFKSLENDYPVLYQKFKNEEEECFLAINKYQNARNSVKRLAKHPPQLPSSISQQIKEWAADYQRKLRSKGIPEAFRGTNDIPSDKDVFRLIVERKGKLHIDSFDIRCLIPYIISGGREDYKPLQDVYIAFLKEYHDKLLKLSEHSDMIELKESFFAYENFINVSEQLLEKLQNMLYNYLNEYGIII